MDWLERRTATPESPGDRQQRPFSDPALGAGKRIGQQDSGAECWQMPRGWEIRYGRRPLLLETLVDAARFRGTCYRAANWIHIGQTTERGRMDRAHQADGLAVKDIYVYPLTYDTRRRLCGHLTR